MYNRALTKVKQGGKILLKVVFFQEKGTKVMPCETRIAKRTIHLKSQHETFAPVLYLWKYSVNCRNALDVQNGVAQGLLLRTNNLREAVLSVAGSDCGIANVNIGTLVLKSVVLWRRKRNRWWA
jgi:aldehyde dehydrogenase (NAD+)